MKSWNCTILNSFFWEPAEDSQDVDVSFVPMMLRRRCSQFTKMCFSAAHHSITEGENLPVISVSKYGEIQRQYAISKKIIETKEVSPTAFSFSVFNIKRFRLKRISRLSLPFCFRCMETATLYAFLPHNRKKVVHIMQLLEITHPIVTYLRKITKFPKIMISASASSALFKIRRKQKLPFR